MKIEVQNNAGNFEPMVCDECGYSAQWDVTDTEDGSTAFACDCQNTSPYIKDDEWRRVEETLTIDIDDSDPLSLCWFYDHTGNHWEQWLVFDFERGELRTSEKRHSDNSISGEEFRNMADCVLLPENVNAAALVEWLRSEPVQKLLLAVLSGYESQWDGSNWVGRLGEMASSAWEEFSRTFADECPRLDEGGPMDAADYWDAVTTVDGPTFTIAAPDGPVTVTIATTEDECASIAEKLDRQAREDGVVTFDTEGYLQRLRERCYEE